MMALVNCPECDNPVSTKAESCPQCGCPIGESQPAPIVGSRKRGQTVRPDFWHDPNVGALALLGLVVLAIIIFFVAAYFFG